MTPLERALLERIRSEGPITLEAYMAACNDYYYSTRDPLGRGGDFTTAPEISQMFGELVGAAITDAWNRASRPDAPNYVELGPGRGTLAADALRVMAAGGLEPAVHFVETSPVLRAQQEKMVPQASWHEDFAEVPAAPLLAVANEFLDALPVRQFVDGKERRVVAAGGGLAFDRDGEVVEQSPARIEIVSALAQRIAEHGGVALIIDYGHERSAPGDTLQAVRGHRFAPVLQNPGEQDLTSHVDFESIAQAARAAGACVTPVMSQRDWLNALGIGARAAALASVNPERADELASAVHRLTGRDEMGDLFKVIAIHAPDWPQPAGFE